MSQFDVQKVVVPVDFSEESFRAVDMAMGIVGEDASKVYVIHVLAELSAADPGVVWGEVSDDNRSKNVKDALAERLPGELLDKVNIEVTFGDAGLRIADFSKTIEADLIVIPSHGRTGIERLLIGSVAERVIQHAHCPVLVLRGGRE